MQKLIARLPGADLALWLAPLGQAISFAFAALSFRSFANFSWKEYRNACLWMGIKSFHLIATAGVVVATALVVELVVELKKYQAQDVTGAFIAVGLLREVGPLVVGLAWCARVAAYVSDQAAVYGLSGNKEDFAASFILPRLLAALSMALPLSAYGLVLGFISAAVVSPLVGGPGPNQFIHLGVQALHNKDLVAYFLKLAVVNPIIAVFAGSVCGRWHAQAVSPAANAVTATFICGFIANLAVTIILFYK